jgi:hypothetical protein
MTVWKGSKGRWWNTVAIVEASRTSPPLTRYDRGQSMGMMADMDEIMTTVSAVKTANPQR